MPLDFGRRHEAAVGFPANHPTCSARGDLFHGLDYVRRADPCLSDGDVTGGRPMIHGVIDADRHHHRVRLKEIRRDDSQKIAAEKPEFPLRVDTSDERAITVAVCGKDGVNRPVTLPGLVGETLEQLQLPGGYRLRIDRDEALAASHWDRLGTQSCQ